MLEKVLSGEGYPEDQVACAPRLMGVILQHCRGRVNDCVGEARRAAPPGPRAAQLRPGWAAFCLAGRISGRARAEPR